MGDERGAAQRHRIAIMQNTVDRVLLAAGFHSLQQRHILGHRHHLGAGHLLDESVPLLVVAMGMVAEQNLDV